MPASATAGPAWSARPPAPATRTSPPSLRPVRRPGRALGLAWLASSSGSTRSSPRPAPALIYQTSTSRVSYGLAGTGTSRHLRPGRQPRRPVVRHDRRVHRAASSSCSRSRAGTRWSAWSPRRSVLMYAGAPLSLGAFRGQAARARAAVPAARRGSVWPPSRSSSPACSSTGPASRRSGSWASPSSSATSSSASACASSRAAEAASEAAGGDLAAGLPARHGHHLLAGPVRRRQNTGRPLLHPWDILVVIALSAWRSTTGRCTAAAHGGDRGADRGAGRDARADVPPGAGSRSDVPGVPPHEPHRLTSTAGPGPVLGAGPDASRPLRSGWLGAAPAAERPVARAAPPPRSCSSGTGPKRALSTAPGGRVVRRQPPAPVLAPGRALDQQEIGALGVPGEHDLAGPDPAGAPGEQPVARAQVGQHGLLGDRDPQQRPAVEAGVHV